MNDRFSIDLNATIQDNELREIFSDEKPHSMTYINAFFLDGRTSAIPALPPAELLFDLDADCRDFGVTDRDILEAMQCEFGTWEAADAKFGEASELASAIAQHMEKGQQQ